MKEIYFIFQKRGAVILYAFKLLRGTSDIRIIDEDKRNLDNHGELMQIEGLRESLEGTSWSTQKTLMITVSNEVYDDYVGGKYTTEYDELMSSQHTGDHTPSAPRTPANEDSAPKSVPVDLNSVTRLLLEQQRSNHLLMEQFMSSMSNLMGKRESKKMTITRFDGSNEDARTWLVLYKRACEANGWDDDELKINNLKSCFPANSAADRWFSSRIIDQGSASWSSWESDFLGAFCQNRIQAASQAIRYEYRHGPLTDYYYEKERLLKLAFPDIGEYTFISHIMYGLPAQMQSQLMTMDPKSRHELIACLQKMTVIDRPRRDNNSNYNRDNRKDVPTKQQTANYTTQQKRQHTFDNKRYPSTDKRQGKVNQVLAETDTTVNVVNKVKQLDGRELPVYSVNCNGIVVNALLDSGSNTDLVSHDLVIKHNWMMKHKTKIANGFSGAAVTSLGTCDLQISFSVLSPTGRKEVAMPTTASVFDNMNNELILGYPSLVKAGIELNPVPIPSLSCSGHLSSTDKVVKDAHDVDKLFPSLLRATYVPLHDVPFKLRDDSHIIQCKPYRLSKERYSWLQGKINSLLEANFIRKSTSNYASPVVIVTKENGDYRLCVDYRMINELTDLDPFPFPIIDDVIVKFGGCNYFSKFDLRDGFNQIGLTEETRRYTAFTTPFGLSEWNRLPFGWKNSPPLFQRQMTEVLGDLLELPTIAVYIDDIICGANTEKDNQELTFRVMQRLEEFGMTINLDKCSFNKKSVVFLGRIIDGRTKTTKEESVDKVSRMSPRTDLHSLRVFLGLTGHFRGFIPDYACLARPLDSLRKKDAPFIWSEECQQSFDRLKEIITSNPILSLPDWNLNFELTCDASNLGTGSILYQRDVTQPRNRQLRVIGYQSYTFTPEEVNYSVTEKECLAVIKAIDYFRSYLEGTSFTVNTDHSALTSLLTLREAKNRLARWQTKLLSYNMKINHRAGILLKDADAISRLCLDVKPAPSYRVNTVVAKADKEMIQLIMKRYHDDSDSGGHDGVKRMYYKILPRFSWPGMKATIKDYVDTCHECQVTKFKYRKKHNFLTVVTHALSAYSTIHLDFGELEKKKEGVKRTKSFLLLVDEFTRMTHTKAMGMKSTLVIKWMESLPFISDVKRIISDNGKSFDCREFREFAKRRNITLNFISPFYSPGNGMAERHVAQIKLFIALYPNFPGGWKSCLEAATKHHNRSYCSAIGCTPLFKSTGEPTLFPADGEFGIIADKLTRKEVPLTEEEQLAMKEKVVDKANKGKTHIPDIQKGDHIIYQAGYKGKHPVIKGPVAVEDVVMRNEIPKVLVIQEGNKERAVALRHALQYKPRQQAMATNIALICCISLLLQSTTSGSFSKESPLIWTRSETPVIGEVQHYQHKVIVEQFCNDFLNITAISVTGRNLLVKWCLSRMEKDIYKPFKEFCIDGLPTHVLHKRLIDPLSMSIAVGAFTFLSATSITSLVMSTQDRDKIKLQEEQVHMLRKHNEKVRDYLSTIVPDMINVTRRLEQVEEHFNRLYSTYPELSTLISDTSSAFEQRGFLAKEVRRSWHLKKVSPYLFELFEFHLPPHAILSQAEAISCSLNEKEGLIVLDYLIPLAAANITLYEANPFEMITDQGSKQEQTCVINYIGPPFALVTPDCVIGLKSDSNEAGRTAFILHPNIICTNSSVRDDGYWTPGRCFDSVAFPAQVKVTSSGNFIYCPGHEIGLDEYKRSCPKFVFSLPRGSHFTIDQFSYKSSALLSAKNFSLVDHIRINSFIYPNGSDGFSTIPGLEHILDEMRKEENWTTTLLSNPMLHIGLTLSLMVVMSLTLLFLLIIYIRKRNNSISPRVDDRTVAFSRVTQVVPIEEA